MRKSNRKPVYSAKPGECENVLVKDYDKKPPAAYIFEMANVSEDFLTVLQFGRGSGKTRRNTK
jgi:hypothetical protein